MTLTYPAQISKERLDKYLQAELGDRTRSQIQKLILSGAITVNGEKAAVHHWLKTGDQIEIPDHEAPETPKTIYGTPAVIFEHPDFIIIQKPAGILVHPTERNEPYTLVTWLLQRYPELAGIGGDPTRSGIVHRLDRDVSGLMLIPRTEESFKIFQILFHDRTIIKRYRCLVYGRMENDEGEIATPLERNKKSGKMIAQSESDTGREALTRYRVIERFTNYTLLEVQIKTGRTHQIRAHLFSIGHSIVGDTIYITRDIRKRRDVPILDRPFLVATDLTFTDTHGEQHSFSIDLPDDFIALLQTLRSKKSSLQKDS